MNQIKCENVKDIPSGHKCEHHDYEYDKQRFLPRSESRQCTVSIYTVPPQKSAYPYHFHTKNEEVFYIISGTGLLRTPEGTRTVSAGDMLYFPANKEGAHKLTNASETDALVYIDFDTTNDIDVSFYPDSQKIGVWGMDINRVYKTDANVDYYEDE
ncbi:MAG: cupin domain-containing protein [Eubacteriales bacterium]|nr:cupin domain-containing protein [Eubacteriales bacterium]